uniref:BTB domain-containing protein n=1 Tax=Branchiostoma floridae TaxID=7739 RepID=C3YU09_BRAFL|eukprot:XP_002600274.1 hypothetical protein BRAFLDRAFT_66779 [Branchiostoma floridae]
MEHAVSILLPRFSMKKKVTYTLLDLSQSVQGYSARLKAFQNRTGEECKGRTGFGTFTDRHRGHELLRELARQYKNGEFVDLVVKVEGREFRCHRAVLASMPFFRTMLSSNFAESRSGLVQLHDVNPDSFSKILDFLYLGKLCIKEEDVESLVKAAHMLQLEKVLDYCKTFMIECLSPSNCLDVLHFAGRFDMTTLKKEARCVSVASEGRHLYVTGGQDPATSMFSLPPPSRQAFRYDFPTDTWLTLPDMPRGRAGHQSVVVGGKLFLVGGHDEDKSQFSIDCYDIREGAWIKPPTLPAIDASSDFTVTVCKSKLLIIQVSQKIATNPTVDSAQSLSEYPILYVHAYDVATDRAVYAVVPLKSAVRKENIWITVVEDKLYLYLFEGHPDHGDYLQNRNQIYAYDTKEGSLCKVDVVNGAGLTGSFIRTQQQGMTSFVIKHTFKGRVRIKGIIETKVCIPFALEGHTCLGVKKSGIGWYCRDKLQTLGDKEVEDVAPKAESSASGSAGS